MPVPTFDQFIEPILRFLHAHPNGMSASEVHEAASNALNLSDTDKQELLPGGTSLTYKNRSGWAYDRLKRAGLCLSPRRGHWQITEAGKAYLNNHPNALTASEIDNLASDYNHIKIRSSISTSEESKNTQQTITNNASPDDQIAQALTEIKMMLIGEILDTLKRVSPSYFESIVLDLLYKLGYGSSRSDLQRVGGSGDGGIDGIISLDKLGLEKVYIQAKRWQNSVGRPEIQGFYGALAGQRATKGVFITTSSFTTHAIEFAQSIERIVLIDGIKLSELMIDAEVGVSSRTIKIPKFDSDYFDE